MALRDLPSVHDLAATLDGLPERIRMIVAREAIEHARTVLLDGGEADAAADATRTAATLSLSRPTSIRNATGIVVHTNLGRVPLHPAAVAALTEAGSGYGNVEFDLATGQRGGRGAWVRRLLTELTGAEDAHVVGNNAGALFAALKVLAEGREVPVSRGELIEIGGSYRLPELMSASGVHLVEVGTTNRTRAGDYASATGPATGLILKVHPSNYRV
ncbi:MAG: L-seryl-tRNA(Sec) selenium transferase, partial [Acidimicrobiia bacterium]|nr:L-seryl-tRNA(Sec) selenium transferase [Acidimicrobiia bacterium]